MVGGKLWVQTASVPEQVVLDSSSSLPQSLSPSHSQRSGMQRLFLHLNLSVGQVCWSGERRSHIRGEKREQGWSSEWKWGVKCSYYFYYYQYYSTILKLFVLYFLKWIIYQQPLPHQHFTAITRGIQMAPLICLSFNYVVLYSAVSLSLLHCIACWKCWWFIFISPVLLLCNVVLPCNNVPSAITNFLTATN